MLEEIELHVKQSMHQLKALKDFFVNSHADKRFASVLIDAELKIEKHL